MRLTLSALAVCASLLAPPASADDIVRERIPPPICRRQEVLDVVGRELRTRTAYSRLAPALVTEQPTANPSIVHCAACLEVLSYDTPALGPHPALACEPHSFDVLSLDHGLRVLGIN